MFELFREERTNRFFKVDPLALFVSEWPVIVGAALLDDSPPAIERA